MCGGYFARFSRRGKQIKQTLKTKGLQLALCKLNVLREDARRCKEWQEWEGRDGFMDRMLFTRRVMHRTIEEEWTPVFGPGGKPLWMCAEGEIFDRENPADAPF